MIGRSFANISEPIDLKGFSEKLKNNNMFEIILPGRSKKRFAIEAVQHGNFVRCHFMNGTWIRPDVRHFHNKK